MEKSLVLMPLSTPSGHLVKTWVAFSATKRSLPRNLGIKRTERLIAFNRSGREEPSRVEIEVAEEEETLSAFGSGELEQQDLTDEWFEVRLDWHCQ